MRRLKIVILDYDMTLIDTLIDFYEALNRTLEHYGLEKISYSEFLKLFKEDRLGLELVPDYIDPRDFWRYFRRVYESRYARPSKGAEYFLYMMKLYGARNIIVTGREVPSVKIWWEVRKFNLHRYIDEIYTMYDLHLMGGIERELFDKSWLLIWILRRHGASPEEAVMLGDYWIDALSSRNAGIAFIGVTEYDERARDLYMNGAEVVVKNLYEAVEAVHDLMSR